MSEPSRRVAIVAAEFDRLLADAMVDAARGVLLEAGATIARVVRVPGCYEIPILAARLVQFTDVDALVALGSIERGETLHGEVMGHVVHAALVQLQLETGKPIGIGIIGPGATADQAEARKIPAAQAAARAVLQVSQLLEGLDTP
jgi:6,7-dimethyl-8-ribityllumazine synthase